MPGFAVPPQDQSFDREVRVRVNGAYRVALPDGYDADPRRRWPLVIFLHGSGERGSDLSLTEVHGPLKEIRNGRRIPAIVVAPQCPADRWWDVPTLDGLLADLQRRYRVDRRRVLLTGISMGGYGSWAWAAARPEVFAAVAPVCAGGSPADAARLKGVPVWAIHGDADPAVPYAEGKAMADALAAGGTVRFDTVPKGGHDVWTAFYARDDFWAWLLAQRR